MSYTYSYEVIATNTDRKEMTLRYTSPGRQTVDVTVGLPLTGQPLSEVVVRHEPTYLWEFEERTVASVVPGMAGSGTTAPTVLVNPGVPFQQFYGLFTDTERDAVVAATQTDVQAKRRYDELMMLELVSTAVPEVEMLLSRLVTLGAITGARKSAIIAAMG